MTEPLDPVRLRALLGERHPVAAAAVIRPDRTEVATLATTEDADLEVGSIAKGLTGLLYADALERGEVRPDTRLDELLPLEGAPAGAITLGSLVVHRSGLPSLPGSAQPWRRTLALWRHGTNPYGETLDELIEQARTVRLRSAAARYSNLGFELLGHALAAAAGTTYVALLDARLSAPLGLRHTSVPTDAAQLGPLAVVGRSRRGRPAEPWTGEALGPAGGVRSSISDLVRLTTALLDGSVPGIGALEPTTPMGRGARIGAAWITVGVGEREVCFHNGRTGGFASWLGVHRAAGVGAVVLSATAASVDGVGVQLLTDA